MTTRELPSSVIGDLGWFARHLCELLRSVHAGDLDSAAAHHHSAWHWAGEAIRLDAFCAGGWKGIRRA